jgi:hypothetical protein
MDPWTMSGRGPRWTSGVELTGAWPPAAPVCKVAAQGVGEGEWNTGNPMVDSPELGRQRGSWVTVVRATTVGTPVRSALRLGEWEMGVGMGAVRRGELLALL